MSSVPSFPSHVLSALCAPANDVHIRPQPHHHSYRTTSSSCLRPTVGESLHHALPLNWRLLFSHGVHTTERLIEPPRNSTPCRMLIGMTCSSLVISLAATLMLLQVPKQTAGCRGRLCEKWICQQKKTHPLPQRGGRYIPFDAARLAKLEMQGRCSRD